MSGLPAGRYYPGNTRMYRLDARVKIVSLLLLLVAVAGTAQVSGYASLVLLCAVLTYLSGLPMRVALGSIARLWPFLLVVFGMNALFFGSDTPLWRWWIVSLSAEGVRQGVRVVISVALLMVLSNLLTATTRPTEITDALTRLLKPLGRIGVPVTDVSMILAVAIRFIPTLMEEADMIRMSQTARGARFDSKRLFDKAASVLPLIIPVFLSAFKRADDLATAMEARGYRGTLGRTEHRSRRLSRADRATLLSVCLVCAIQIWLFR